MLPFTSLIRTIRKTTPPARSSCTQCLQPPMTFSNSLVFINLEVIQLVLKPARGKSLDRGKALLRILISASSALRRPTRRKRVERATVEMDPSSLLNKKESNSIIPVRNGELVKENSPEILIPSRSERPFEIHLKGLSTEQLEKFIIRKAIKLERGQPTTPRTNPTRNESNLRLLETRSKATVGWASKN